MPRRAPDVEIYATELEGALVRDHGYLIGGSELCALLCYPSSDALRQAVRRGRTPIPIFPIPHRRGHYAIARDIARWMASCRASAQSDESPGREAQPR